LYRQIIAEQPDLREKLTPQYAFGYKRPVFFDNYYPTFLRANMYLDDSALLGTTEKSVVTEEG
jgi:hypothetical protein